MKAIRIFQVDAFTEKLFGGNPAAVCVLDYWLDDSQMQSIAFENNLAETAFVVANKNEYGIRWFTPTVEVDLCGHATLASAFVLFTYYHPEKEEIVFHSHRSGYLNVKKSNALLTLDFPADEIVEVDCKDEISKAIGITPIQTWKGKTDYLAILKTERDVHDLQPDLVKVAKLDARGLIVSAPGNQVDFVSRFFAPQSGIDEDPVTGSAHTTLTVYWAQKTDKLEFAARQLSKRSGSLRCSLHGNRVHISGKATLYLTGEIHIP